MDGNPVYPMRLQKFLARAGVASRRGSENLMTAGRVAVNGHVVRELGSKVDPLSDTVTVDGKPVVLGTDPVYLILNKPEGYLTTMSDPFGRPCVAELVADADAPGLFPVGRLDFDTTGLLFFTTDGEAGQNLLHPSHHVDKHYRATLDRLPDEAGIEALRAGIVLDDGPCSPADSEVLSYDPPICGISIHEGRKHQVKRMFEAIGCTVVSLHRDAFGPLTIDGVAPGTWRMLTDSEIDSLFACIGRKD